MAAASLNRRSPGGISVLIPTYEMRGVGPQMLERALTSIESQVDVSGLRIEVVVSDHSRDDAAFHAAQKFRNSESFHLNYIRNERQRGSSSANLNRAFQESHEPLVKILLQDDFFVANDALKVISQIFEDMQVSWSACGTTHTSDGQTYFGNMQPKIHPQIHFGNNTMSSPSVISLRRENWVPFDTRLIWLMDVDFYRRMLVRHGNPKIIQSTLVAHGIGPHQVTETRVSNLRKRIERLYVSVKHLVIL